MVDFTRLGDGLCLTLLRLILLEVQGVYMVFTLGEVHRISLILAESRFVRDEESAARCWRLWRSQNKTGVGLLPQDSCVIERELHFYHQAEITPIN